MNILPQLNLLQKHPNLLEHLKKKTSSKQKITGPNTIPVFIHHAVHILDMYKRMSVQKYSDATSVKSVCLGCSVLPALNGSVRLSLAGPLALGKLTLCFSLNQYQTTNLKQEWKEKMRLKKELVKQTEGSCAGRHATGSSKQVHRVLQRKCNALKMCFPLSRMQETCCPSLLLSAVD